MPIGMISASRTAVAWGSLWAALSLAPTSALAGPIVIDNVRESPLALTAAVLMLQMTLGGLVSSNYAGLACPD